MAGRLGVATGLRLVFSAAAIAATAAAGLIVARTLDPRDYAIYQLVTKRIQVYLFPLAAIVAFWSYRYVAAGIKGAPLTALILSMVNSLIAMALCILILEMYVGDVKLVLASATLIALNTIFIPMTWCLTAYRYVRASLIMAGQRIVYFTLIIIMLFLYGLDATLVMTAASLSIALLLAASLAQLSRLLLEGACPGCAKAWIKGAGVPALLWTANFLVSLDVVIILSYVGELAALSAFFVALLPFSLILEASSRSLAHLQALAIAGVSAEKLAIGRLVVFLLGPLIGIMIVRPELVIAVINPLYVESSSLLLAILAAGLPAAIVTNAVQGITLGATGKPGLPGEVKGLLRISLVILIASIAYLGFILLAALTVSGERSLRGLMAMWALATVARHVLLLTLFYVLYPALRASIRADLSKSTLYTAVAAIASAIIPAEAGGATLISQLLSLLKALSGATAIYIAVSIIIDKDARRYVIKGVNLAKWLASRLSA